jgi:hypothetical protein
MTTGDRMFKITLYVERMEKDMALFGTGYRGKHIPRKKHGVPMD